MYGGSANLGSSKATPSWAFPVSHSAAVTTIGGRRRRFSLRCGIRGSEFPSTHPARIVEPSTFPLLSGFSLFFGIHGTVTTQSGTNHGARGMGSP